jgi:hypothetical protein
MRDNTPPRFLSVADGSNLPRPLSAHRREKRRMKKATRDLNESDFNPNSMIPLNTRISLEEIESRSVTCLFR